MKILSIPLLHHDSSICILQDGKITFYEMMERLSRKKHDHSINLHNIKNDEFDKIIVSQHFLDNHYDNEKISSEFEFINEKIKKISHKELITKKHEHHIFHAYSGFYNSKFDEAICLSIDGTGAILENNYVEIESVYLFKKNKNYKKLYQKTREFVDVVEGGEDFFTYVEKLKEKDLSVGERFAKFSTNIGFSALDGPGKVMGLAQYKNYKEKLQYPYNSKENKQTVDKSYDIQRETQNHILKLIKKYTEKTGVKNVVISGGYALNCVANYHYLKNLKNINLFIDPICFDAGISIGLAYYHYPHKDKIKPLENVYIGHEERSFNLKGLNTKKVSYDDIVELLLQQKVVSLFQGKSEAGQRALGNRSLLFDPRNPEGKDIVNEIKKRENFRPFAGTILKEESHKWFDMHSLDESPYMQYAMDAYKNAIEQVPAIIHADNTCRIQTVTQEQNKHFYNLISCFFKKTRVPMLMNTSFNLGGEPLVETFEHAIHTLKCSMIEYLYLPEIETLVTVKNKKILYR